MARMGADSFERVEVTVTEAYRTEAWARAKATEEERGRSERMRDMMREWSGVEVRNEKRGAGMRPFGMGVGWYRGVVVND